MSMISELLRIKSFRENQAELQMHRQYEVTRLAHEKHESEQRRLADLLREGMETEDRLFGELCQHIVQLREIEDVRHTVASLRQQEDRQRDAVQAARQAEAQEDQALLGARAVHHDAFRQKTKFEDLLRDFDLAATRDAERREDMELEESASIRRYGSDPYSYESDGIGD